MLENVTKSLLSFIATTIIVSLMNLIIYIPQKFKDPMNRALRTRNKLIVPRMQYDNYKLTINFSTNYLNHMRCKFDLYIICFTLLNLYCLYYVCIFNLIYEASSEAWLLSAFTSFILDLCGLSILLPLIQSGIRSLARKEKSCR